MSGWVASPLVYAGARERWLALASDRHTREPSEIDGLQHRIHAWATEQFGVCHDWKRTLGIAEEYAELEESVQKDDVPEILDSCADLCVFAMALAEELEFDFWEARVVAGGGAIQGEFKLWTIGAALSKIRIASGRLAQAVLKHSEGIRGFADRGKYLDHCAHAIGNIGRGAAHVSAVFGSDITELTLRVAREVLKRDWKNRPTDAHIAAKDE